MYHFIRKKFDFTPKEEEKIGRLEHFFKNGMLFKPDYNRKFFSTKDNIQKLKLLNKYIPSHTPKAMVGRQRVRAIFGDHIKRGKKYIWRPNSKVSTREVMIIAATFINGKDVTKGFSCKGNERLCKGLKEMLEQEDLVPDIVTRRNFLKDKKGKVWYVDSRWPLFSGKQGDDYRKGKDFVNKL